MMEIEPLEHARMLWDVLTCGETIVPTKSEFTAIIAAALLQAKKAEREACAKVADAEYRRANRDEFSIPASGARSAAKSIAAVIRDRGKEGT